MYKLYLKQSLQMLKQNKFFSIISIVGTALTIAFVMVIYMVYDIRTDNVSPENNRDRMVYSGDGYSYLTKDHSSCNSGMSLKAAKTVFGSLPHAELVAYEKESFVAYAGSSQENGMKRKVKQVDTATWKLFHYQFIAGRPFNDEEFSAFRKVAVITESVAKQTFYTTDVVGKDILVNFQPYRIVGVIKDISSLFDAAFSEVWIPYDLNAPDWRTNEQMYGVYKAIVLAKSPSDVDVVKKEIANNVRKLNKTLVEHTFEMQKTYTQVEHSFLKDSDLNPMWIFFGLALVLLIVPAINISGLLSSQMNKRLSEIGVRKAYGAHKYQVLTQLMTENFILALIGGIIGFIFSCVTLYIFKAWLLAGDTALHAAQNFDISIFLFLRPSVFAGVFLACLLFNLLSVFIPAYQATKKNIIDALKGE